MPKSKELTYKLLPAWAMHQSDKTLVIIGGADARYEIELETSGPSFFSTLKPGSAFSRSVLEESDKRVLEELVTAEIVAPNLPKVKGLRLAITGDIKSFVFPANKDIKIVAATEAYDTAIVVRINSTYAGLLEKINYTSITKPHLFVDMAFHHTLSVGPLVFPGETACVACLQGRVSTRWGDEAPPVSPQVFTQNGGLATEIIAAELARVSNGDTSLTNKTVSWNFQDRSIRKDQLLKVPLCPICSRNKIDQSGALALPWDKDESITDTV